MSALKTDVLIAGGGAAGVAAAAGASACGVSVMLLERNSYLGGKATAAMVGTVCGAYFRSGSKTASYVMSGFPKLFVEKLKAAGKTEPVAFSEGLHFLPYDVFAFKLVCDDILEKNKVETYHHTVLSGCNCAGGSIDSVEAISLDRKIIVEPKAVVDCTGEALVSTLCNLEILEGEHYQAPALVFSMENVESDEQFKLNLEMGRLIRHAVDAGSVNPVFERVSVIPGSLKNGRVHLKIGFLKRAGNSVNKTSEIEKFGRKTVGEVSDFLVNHVAAFRNSRLGTVAPEVGIRTGRRPVGKYILQEEDVLQCRKFDDGIANGAWPIEFWGDDKRVRMTYFDMDGYYQIPVGSLISSALNNLFFAGRNISATESAIASARIIGTCLGTGYAAGKMAAFFALGKDMKEAVVEIRNEQVLL